MLRLYFVDVEHGQAACLLSSTGAKIAYDGGSKSDPGRAFKELLIKHPFNIDTLVFSHFHFDHYNGL